MTSDKAPSRLDKLISAVSPIWGLKRAAARQYLAYYDGAARSHRTAGRKIPHSSANRETWTSLPRLRDVSRDQARNNVHIRRAVDVLEADIVGAGITPSIKGPKRVKEKVEDLIRGHLETPAIDVDGRNNIFGLQALAVRTMVESGEALVVRYRPPAALRLKVPLQVRVLEPDYLNSLADTGAGEAGNRIIQGIEFDKAGRRVAYHLYDEHPGDITIFNPQSKRVPAEDVIHLYRVDRPGQIRGVPWGAACIITAWDFADFDDAELVRQKIAACYAVFFTDTMGATKLASTPGSAPTQSGQPVDMLEPGMQQRLPPGVDVKFATPPGHHGYEAFIRAQKQKIAICFGVTFESLSGDLAKVNYSSGRMGWLVAQRLVTKWQWQIVIPHLCCGIGQWFLDAAEFAVPGAARCTMAHTEPKREMINPKEEIAAARDLIRSGLSTRSRELRRMGEDPIETDQENHDDQKRADDLDLRFDSDGRHALAEPAAIRGPAELAPEADSETAKPAPEKETEDA